MTDDELIVEESGTTLTVSFNRPAARNALTLDMVRGITEALRSAAGRNDLRAVVLRGAGEQPFSAGFGIDQLPDHALTTEEVRALLRPVRDMCDAIRDCPHPVVGAARRFIFGAALDMFCHCDLRICAEGTTFTQPANRLGVLYPNEGLKRYVDVMGLARATEMMLMGAAVSTAEALACGLVQKVYAAPDFEAGLAAMTAQLAANAPLSTRMTKHALWNLRRDTGDAAVQDAMFERIAVTYNSEDMREALAAFREKRQPVFKGR